MSTKPQLRKPIRTTTEKLKTRSGKMTLNPKQAINQCQNNGRDKT